MFALTLGAQTIEYAPSLPRHVREECAGIAQLVERNLAKVVGGRPASREIATAAVL